MNNTTICKKCIFNNDKEWCEFSIPQSIIDQTKLDTNSQIIKNYRCSYAFGSETFNKQNLFDKTYIKEQIIELNKIKYTLLIDFDHLKTNSKDICDILINLNFKPKNILCFGKKLTDLDVKYFQQHSPIPWKLNKILPTVEYPIGIVSAIDTIVDKYNSIGFLFIKNIESIKTIDNTINQIHINYIINHNKTWYFQEKYDLNNLFMFYDTYKNIGIDKIVFFDEPKNFFNLSKYQDLSIAYYD